MLDSSDRKGTEPHTAYFQRRDEQRPASVLLEKLKGGPRASGERRQRGREHDESFGVPAEGMPGQMQCPSQVEQLKQELNVDLNGVKSRRQSAANAPGQAALRLKNNVPTRDLD